ARGEIRELHVAAAPAEAEEPPDQDTDTGAVDRGHVGEIDDKVDPVLADERVHGLAEHRVAVFQDEAPAEMQDGHGAPMLGRDLQRRSRHWTRTRSGSSTKWTDCTELVTMRVPMA